MDRSVDQFVLETAEGRRRYALPAGAMRIAEELTAAALALLFPHFATADRRSAADVEDELYAMRRTVEGFLLAERHDPAWVHEVGSAFGSALPPLREALALDARAICEADPAARDLDEVILGYPGFFAIACYRIAHALRGLGAGLLPRLITEFAHRETGIDIHPGAVIGGSLAIDHGTGIVIGETTVIGQRVRLYQGVTLGALSVRKELARHKRHPTIEDDVVIYANATILGGDTVIGAGSIIGGNVWLTHSIPAGSVVTHGATVERPREADEALMEYNI
ncbi:MAG TPA: serine O-acetyltransferase [Gemmatimonadales bacterium]|nr:serine O-acetyltransferase [Gemmatimonadales bacterium]